LSSLTITLCSTPPTLSPYTTLFRSSAQVHHLPYMMIRMPGTTHENLETVRSFRFAIGGVRLPPIVRLLFANRGHYHRDRSIEGAQGLVLVRRLFLREFAIAVPHVAGIRDPCPDVIAQI